MNRLVPSCGADRAEAQGPQGRYCQQFSWLALYTEITNNRTILTEVPMVVLTLKPQTQGQYRHQSSCFVLYTEITNSRTILTEVLMVVLTLKPQTQGQYRHQSSGFVLYTEITTTRTIQTAVLRALSVHWNHKHLDNTDGIPHGSVLTLKSQISEQC